MKRSEIIHNTLRTLHNNTHCTDGIVQYATQYTDIAQGAIHKTLTLCLHDTQHCMITGDIASDNSSTHVDGMVSATILCIEQVSAMLLHM